MKCEEPDGEEHHHDGNEAADDLAVHGRDRNPDISSAVVRQARDTLAERVVITIRSGTDSDNPSAERTFP